MAVAARIVSEDEAAIRLDRWFRRHFPGVTQAAIQKLCRTGQVRVDGHRAEAATRLAAGQSVRIPPLPTAPPPKPAPEIDPDTARDVQRMVIYRDDHLLVLNKPAGLPVQGGPGITRDLDALLDALRFGAADRPRLVHRLDRDTSGVLLLARTPGTAAKLAALFRSRAVEKTYWAVVARRPTPPVGRIDLPLRRIGGARGERTDVAEPGDKAAARAVTEYQTIDHAGQKLAWLELHPLTGRTHQLRVHCAESGFPVLGDNIYGSAPRIGGPRLHLHAREIVVPLYKNKPPIKVTAPVPEHMKERLKACGWTEDMDRDVNPPLGLARPPRKETADSPPQGERQ